MVVDVQPCQTGATEVVVVVRVVGSGVFELELGVQTAHTCVLLMTSGVRLVELEVFEVVDEDEDEVTGAQFAQVVWLTTSGVLLLDEEVEIGAHCANVCAWVVVVVVIGATELDDTGAQIFQLPCGKAAPKAGRKAAATTADLDRECILKVGLLRFVEEN